MPVARLLALIAVLALAAAALAGCGEKDEPDLGAATTAAADTTATAAPTGVFAEIAGDWRGRLTQKGLGTFQVAVRIDPSGTAQVAYTGIDCGGEWTAGPVMESDPPQYGFTETIRTGAGGKCKGKGGVTIQRSGDSLTYRFRGGGVTSRGTLNRTDAAGLRPIFKQAGTPPPA